MTDQEKELAERYGFESVNLDDGVATLTAPMVCNIKTYLEKSVDFIKETKNDVILRCGQWEVVLVYRTEYTGE